MLNLCIMKEQDKTADALLINKTAAQESRGDTSVTSDGRGLVAAWGAVRQITKIRHVSGSFDLGSCHPTALSTLARFAPDAPPAA